MYTGCVSCDFARTSLTRGNEVWDDLGSDSTEAERRRRAIEQEIYPVSKINVNFPARTTHTKKEICQKRGIYILGKLVVV